MTDQQRPDPLLEALEAARRRPVPQPDYAAMQQRARAACFDAAVDLARERPVDTPPLRAVLDAVDDRRRARTARRRRVFAVACAVAAVVLAMLMRWQPNRSPMRGVPSRTARSTPAASPERPIHPPPLPIASDGLETAGPSWTDFERRTAVPTQTHPGITGTPLPSLQSPLATPAMRPGPRVVPTRDRPSLI